MLAAIIISNSFMRTLLVPINRFMSRPNWLTITKKIRNRVTSGTTNYRITCITGTDRFSNINSFDELANTVDVMDITDIIGKDMCANCCWFDDLTNTTNLTDITSVVLEETVLLTFNGLMSLLTLLVLQTL